MTNRKKLIIFGVGDAGELACEYFLSDSQYSVAGFSVESKYQKGERFCGLPVFAFESIVERAPPSDYALFTAVGYTQLNSVRERIFRTVEAFGYSIPSYISSRATILNKGVIGRNCFIMEDVTVQPFVRIGENVTIWSGSHIGHHSAIGDHTFLAPRVAVAGRVTVGKSCFIGINATLRDHITIGDRSVIGAGAVVLADTDPNRLYQTPAAMLAGKPLRYPRP